MSGAQPNIVAFFWDNSGREMPAAEMIAAASAAVAVAARSA